MTELSLITVASKYANASIQAKQFLRMKNILELIDMSGDRILPNSKANIDHHKNYLHPSQILVSDKYR